MAKLLKRLHIFEILVVRIEVEVLAVALFTAEEFLAVLDHLLDKPNEHFFNFPLLGILLHPRCEFVVYLDPLSLCVLLRDNI